MDGSRFGPSRPTFAGADAFEASLQNWVNGVGEAIPIDEDQRIARRRAAEIMVEAYLANSSSLNLSSLRLTTLPPEIGSMRAIESLFISYNRLEFLPEEIRNLRNLGLLSALNNRLTTLPDFLFGRDSGVYSILATGNRFSPEEAARLSGLHQGSVRRGNINFNYSIYDRATSSNSYNRYGYDEAGLAYLSGVVAPRSLPATPIDLVLDLEEDKKVKEALKKWLLTGVRVEGDAKSVVVDRLDHFKLLIEERSRTAAWQDGDKNSMQKILFQIIKAAYANPQVANIVNETAAGSDFTCGDRVTMTLLDVQLAALHFATRPKDIDNASDLVKYAKEKSACEFLRKKSEQHYQEMGGGDELDIHLAHMQILPKLGVDVKGLEMLYFRITGVTKERLDAITEEYLALSTVFKGDDLIPNDSDTSLMSSLKDTCRKVSKELALMPYADYLAYDAILNKSEFESTVLVKVVSDATAEMLENIREFSVNSAQMVKVATGEREEDNGEYIARSNMVMRQRKKLQTLLAQEMCKILEVAEREATERDEKYREVEEKEDKESADVKKEDAVAVRFCDIRNQEYMEGVAREVAKSVAKRLELCANIDDDVAVAPVVELDGKLSIVDRLREEVASARNVFDAPKDKSLNQRRKVKLATSDNEVRKRYLSPKPPTSISSRPAWVESEYVELPQNHEGVQIALAGERHRGDIAAYRKAQADRLAKGDSAKKR